MKFHFSAANVLNFQYSIRPAQQTLETYTLLHTNYKQHIWCCAFFGAAIFFRLLLFILLKYWLFFTQPSKVTLKYIAIVRQLDSSIRNVRMCNTSSAPYQAAICVNVVVRETVSNAHLVCVPPVGRTTDEHCCCFTYKSNDITNRRLDNLVENFDWMLSLTNLEQILSLNFISKRSKSKHKFSRVLSRNRDENQTEHREKCMKHNHICFVFIQNHVY